MLLPVLHTAPWSQHTTILKDRGGIIRQVDKLHRLTLPLNPLDHPSHAAEPKHPTTRPVSCFLVPALHFFWTVPQFLYFCAPVTNSPITFCSMLSTSGDAPTYQRQNYTPLFARHVFALLRLLRLQLSSPVFPASLHPLPQLTACV